MTWTDPTTKKEYSYTWGYDHIKAPDIFEKENNKMNIYTLANYINEDCRLVFGDKSIPVRVDSIDTVSSFGNVDETTIKCTIIKPKIEYVPYSKMYNNRKPSTILPSIKKVIFNAPATIIFWSDNTKTVVKCGENDLYDPEKGMAMAISKKVLGNEGHYYETFKKWMKECDAECIYPEIPFIIPKLDIGKYFQSKLEDFIGKPKDHLIAGDDNPPKEEAEPAKKPKWVIKFIHDDGHEYIYSYKYSTKYSAERAARRMFNNKFDWNVEQEV